MKDFTKSSGSERHLSSEELDALLCGVDDAAAAEHVEACARCAGELAAMQRLMGGFRQSAVVVAEQQRAMAQVKPLAAAGWFGAKAWVSFAVMVCGLAWMSPMLLHRATVRPTPVAVVVRPVQPAAQALSDDELLAAVQSDLSDRVPVALQPLATDGKAAKAQ